MLASGGNENTLHLWDVNTGQRIKILAVDKWRIDGKDLVFSPDGKTLAGTGPAQINLWDVNTGQLIRTFQKTTGLPCMVEDLAFSPDGKTLVSAGKREAHLWDVKKGEILQTLIIDDKWNLSR